MGKTAFIFPGQGSQYVGMAREFYNTWEVSRKVFETASQVAGFSIEDLCFRENDKIHQTRYTQVCLLTASCAMLRALEKETNIRADITAGLSLGEYSALVCGDALSFEDAARIVCERGSYMEEAVPAGMGAMAAVISKKHLPIEEICKETDGKVTIANYNCPGQQVISGEKDAVRSASERLLREGAVRVVPLRVSGPFHSPMMKTAGEKLEGLLRDIAIKKPNIPYISNVTAKGEEEPEQIRKLLARQVSSSVLWQQSVEYMIEQGVDTFIEIGPGKSLSGFIRKIDPKVTICQVEKPADIFVATRKMLCEDRTRENRTNKILSYL